jgi:hypothetical protein
MMAGPSCACQCVRDGLTRLGSRDLATWEPSDGNSPCVNVVCTGSVRAHGLTTRVVRDQDALDFGRSLLDGQRGVHLSPYRAKESELLRILVHWGPMRS